MVIMYTFTLVIVASLISIIIVLLELMAKSQDGNFIYISFRLHVIKPLFI